MLLYVIYVRRTITSRYINLGVCQASEPAASAPWAWRVYMTCMSLFSCCQLSFMLDVQSHSTIPILVYMEHAKRPLAPPRPCCQNNAIHDKRVMICTLETVVYVRHTLLWRHTYFGKYQVNETVAREPREWRVNHVVNEMHIMIFKLRPIIHVLHAVVSCHTNFGIHPINETPTRAMSRRRLDR